MRRALAVLAVTAAVVVWLARYDTHPPRRLNPARGEPRRSAAILPTPTPVPSSGARPGTPGTRTGTGPVVVTPFSAIQVRAVVRGRRLVGVATLSLGASDPHTQALNARAEPLLREEALKAGSADVDAVSGATYTSESWRSSLQAAIERARRG
jgi:uncharacterized protein with FMN-binding domain